MFERRLSPTNSVTAIVLITVVSVVLAFAVSIVLFLPFDPNPIRAYASLFEASFGSARGLGMTLNRAVPLILVGLGTCLAWRSGFGYLGFEGCFLIGAAGAAWFALASPAGSLLGSLPFLVWIVCALAFSFVLGGVWSGGVGVLRSRFGGNEVLISLMANYVAIFIVQYLVSGPMRASGSLPQTPRFPEHTWLPMLISPQWRAHAGILIALAAAGLVWLLLARMRIGYELVVTGLNPVAARYGGIDVGRRYVLAAFLAGGLGAWAGLAEVLGAHHRLLDGLSGGLGFVGIVVVLISAES